MTLDIDGDDHHHRRMAQKRPFRVELGDVFSEGARRLWEVMKSESLTPAKITKRLQCATGLVPRWLYGDRRPGVEWAARIEREFGIPAALWGETTKASRAFVPPAERDVAADETDRISLTGTD
jgi:hypothetical protein